MAVRDDFAPGEVLAAADLNDTFASKLPYEYSDSEPTTDVEGFLWYDENDTPPTPKFWDGSAFQDVAPAGGLELITVATVTAASSMSISNVFGSTYTNYRVILDTVSTVSSALNIRFRDSGGDDTTSNYQTAGGFITAGSGLTAEGGTGQTSSQISGVVTTVGGASMDVYLPNAAFPTSFASLGFTQGFGRFYLGQFTTTKAFTGFSLLPGAGLLSATVRVYGYRES